MTSVSSRCCVSGRPVGQMARGMLSNSISCIQPSHPVARWALKRFVCFENFEKQKNVFLFHVPGIIQPKNYVSRPKYVPCSPHTHRQTNTYASDYYGPPFRVSGVFPSTYHRGSAQLYLVIIMRS